MPLPYRSHFEMVGLSRPRDAVTCAFDTRRGKDAAALPFAFRNSKAQCRVAHAGLPITHTTEPQRGSTNSPQYTLLPLSISVPQNLRNFSPSSFSLHPSSFPPSPHHSLIRAPRALPTLCLCAFVPLCHLALARSNSQFLIENHPRLILIVQWEIEVFAMIEIGTWAGNRIRR